MPHVCGVSAQAQHDVPPELTGELRIVWRDLGENGDLCSCAGSVRRCTVRAEGQAWLEVVGGRSVLGEHSGASGDESMD